MSYNDSDVLPIMHVATGSTVQKLALWLIEVFMDIPTIYPVPAFHTSHIESTARHDPGMHVRATFLSLTLLNSISPHLAVIINGFLHSIA